MLIWAGMGGLAALLFVVGLRAAAPLVEPRVFYFPDRAPFGTPRGVIDVTFDSGGLTLHGWLLPAHDDGTPAPTVLFAHGNAGRIPDHVDFVSFLPAVGLNLFV